mmetsp:Transcript_107105/g.308161  ORF Transcript_107105/g.308161 Transcript_107105/m.308161 type:complete len:141 (-) Transcript_107105:100-522(-)
MGAEEDERPQGLIAKVKVYLRAKAFGLGQAALVGYILIDIVVYAVLFLVVRSAFKAMRGQEPWHDPRGFLVAAAATWGGNNATKPLRLAGAAALAPVLEWSLSQCKQRWGVTRAAAGFAMIAALGAVCATIVLTVVLATL